MRIFVDGQLPKYTAKQRFEKDPVIAEKEARKLTDVLDIAPGFVRSLTRYFAVPKCESDIQMVYDASKSDLNSQVWAPNFGLPTFHSALDQLDHGYYMADLDIGEMFLNFPLDIAVRPYVGIDLAPYCRWCF